jgi:archaellum component FlaG (FlaF/FlaG flagellin family)
MGAAVVFGGCSTNSTEADQPAQSTSTGAAAPSDTQSSSATPTNPTGHLGDTLNLKNQGGAPLAVTLLKIINPATGRIGPPRDRTYVATMLTIKNTGTSLLKGDADINTALIGSDNQTYTPNFNSVSECTNFNAGVYELGADESATGCVVFVVPQGVTPAKVKYLPSSGFADNFGEWLIS